MQDWRWQQRPVPGKHKLSQTPLCCCNGLYCLVDEVIVMSAVGVRRVFMCVLSEVDDGNSCWMIAFLQTYLEFERKLLPRPLLSLCVTEFDY